MGGGGAVRVGGSGVLVNLICWHVILRFPFYVSMDFGRFLYTRMGVRPVRVKKKNAFMTLHQVLTTVQKKSWQRNCIKSGSVLIW